MSPASAGDDDDDDDADDVGRGSEAGRCDGSDPPGAAEAGGEWGAADAKPLAASSSDAPSPPPPLEEVFLPTTTRMTMTMSPAAAIKFCHLWVCLRMMIEGRNGVSP